MTTPKIEPNELRIGNLINGFYLDENEVEQSEICKVLVLDSIEMTEHLFWVAGESQVEDYDRFEGIPLTPDWLAKMGFRSEMNANKTNMLYLNDMLSITMVKGEWSLAIVGFMVYPLRTKINYVHQLQNLFFALCGQEIKITI